MSDERESAMVFVEPVHFPDRLEWHAMGFFGGEIVAVSRQSDRWAAFSEALKGVQHRLEVRGDS